MTLATQRVKALRGSHDLPESASQAPVGTDAKLKAERAALEACAFRLIAQHRKVRVELGRTFLRIKATLKHGRWKTYFGEVFGECGISLRSAERYMRMADEADEDPKNDRLSLFEPATDSQAVKTRDATAKAEFEVGHRQKGQVRVKGIFKLPLLLTVDEQKATCKLLNSPNWPSAQLGIITLIKQMCVKFGIADKGPR
jgi:hypothetical protein